MRPRDWARQRTLLRILRKSFFHTNWNSISLEYFFDFSASFMANFPNFQLFKRFRYTFLTLKVVCTWGRGLLSLASGVKRWLRRQYFRISQPGLRWVPYISFCRGGSRIFFMRGCTLLLLYFNTNKPHSFFFFCRIPVVLENRRSSRGGGSHPLHPPPRSAPVLRSLPSPNIDLSAGSWKTRFKKNPILLTLRYRQLLLVSPPSYRPMYPLNKNLGFWETAHLLLPWDNINTYFSLRAKCWLKGGVGGQFPKKKNLNWSQKNTSA